LTIIAMKIDYRCRARLRRVGAVAPQPSDFEEGGFVPMPMPHAVKREHLEFDIEAHRPVRDILFMMS
jgi:hypothetical protein